MTSIGVAEYYADKTIFVTGATGFMGKVLVEKLLRSCPDVKAIYILIREHKGRSELARFEEFTKCRAFERILQTNPKLLDKLRLVPGDATFDGLGISQHNKKRLQKECEIVFHNAASVRFNLPLKQAVTFNTKALQNVLQLAENMEKLEVFIHTSTAFCHDSVEVLEEKVYPATHRAQDIIDLVRWIDDDMLRSIETKIIHPRPNTYSYSKHLSEQLVSEYEGKFPIAIARPSIVVSSYKEPLPGWTDNVNGPTGIIYGSCRGVIHSVYCKATSKVEILPVDIVINGLILLAYFTGLEKPRRIRVCNLTQSGVNELTWIQGSQLWRKYANKYPLSLVLWYPASNASAYYLHHQLMVLLTHLLPACILDMILLALRKKTFMIKTFKRVNHGLKILEYYSARNWSFENDYFKSFQNRITQEENEIFYTDFGVVEFESYVESYVMGLREFYCKEDPSSLPQARQLHKKLYALHVATLGLSNAFFFYISYCMFKKYYLRFRRH